jgi:hypothetical protein
VSEELRLGIGGPLHRLERAAHLGTVRGQMLVAVGITWVPLLVLATVESLLGRSEPLLRDLSVHVRLVIALPLFLAAERVLDLASGPTLARVFEEGFIAEPQRPRVQAMLRAVERWRDSPWPELVLFAIAVGSGVAALAGWTAPAGFIHGVAESRYSIARVWYALVSLPLAQFVIWRALFRWALWIRVLIGLASVPLRLLPWHADRRGGIAFLKIPSLSYGTIVLFALSCMVYAGWATQIVHGGATLQSFKQPFIALVIGGALLVFAPLLLFVPQLVRARLRGDRDFGALVTDYDRKFGERWLGGERSGLLGTPDAQSLNDLGSTYHTNVEDMTPLLFTARDALGVLVISQLPALPVLLTTMPAQEVLKRLLHLFMGGD